MHLFDLRFYYSAVLYLYVLTDVLSYVLLKVFRIEV